ncbi:hypothetical protein EC988_007051 [Linderina pennispora]|nr:hypothetical protein EC988_007051 [Linderina pennispora]
MSSTTEAAAVPETNPFFSLVAKKSREGSNGGDSEVLESMFGLDDEYWKNVEKARTIRKNVIKMRGYLGNVQPKLEAEKRTQELARMRLAIANAERKLMKYINYYVLNYDDVIADTAPSTPKVASAELGVPLSPPTSPASGAPDRPLPPPPAVAVDIGKAPPYVSDALPPTPKQEKRRSNWSGLFGGVHLKYSLDESVSTDNSGHSKFTNSQPLDG